MNNTKLEKVGNFKSFDNSFKEIFKNDKKPLHIISVGNLASDILKFIYNNGIEAKYTIISDNKKNCKDSAIEFIDFAPPQKKVMMPNGFSVAYSDMNNRLQMPDTIYKRLESDNKFIIITALDDYTGIFFTEDVANYLSKKNKLCLIISSYLFEDSKAFKESEDTRKKLSLFENFIEPDLNECKKMGFKACFQKINELFFEIINDYKER